jgi:cellulose synthase/poly-beta-1,6-N-acetylglucosamine synthase-like glycosyltransferase
MSITNYLADSARITTSRLQLAAILVLLGSLVAGLLLIAPVRPLFLGLLGALWIGMASWRLLCLYQPVSAPPAVCEASIWPRYTVVAALYDEAAIIPQLVERLSQIDYPADRLQGFLALEAHDFASQQAAQALELPSWLTVLVVPPGSPQTKPRALNYALERATGDIITVYDAEDDPDPLQLKEAAQRFLSGGSDLICLQAPLRIRRKSKQRSRTPFLDKQFAVEYAALFEVTLPALTQLGLPFPLGGTSNHFRTQRLREIGGWDAWNVTEDADLGFRIWRTGGRLGTLNRPTYETPPGDLNLWLPQRTRWIKGYMQTILVHTRHSVGMGWRGWLAMALTIGAGLVSAGVHALSMAWIVAICLNAAISRQMPPLPPVETCILLFGIIASLLLANEGAKRAGTTFGIKDMVQAPIYWSLLTLAFAHALARLIFEPHRWDKTPHRPEVIRNEAIEVYADAGRQAA